MLHGEITLQNVPSLMCARGNRDSLDVVSCLNAFFSMAEIIPVFLPNLTCLCWNFTAYQLTDHFFFNDRSSNEVLLIPGGPGVGKGRRKNDEK